MSQLFRYIVHLWVRSWRLIQRFEIHLRTRKVLQWLSILFICIFAVVFVEKCRHRLEIIKLVWIGSLQMRWILEILGNKLKVQVLLWLSRTVFEVNQLVWRNILDYIWLSRIQEPSWFTVPQFLIPRQWCPLLFRKFNIFLLKLELLLCPDILRDDF